MRSLCLTLLSSTSLLLATSVGAQTIDQAGADALEAQVPLVLDFLFQGSPDVNFAFDGEVEAVPDGDSYDLSIPAITVDVNGDADVAVPPFAVEVTPQDNGWQRARWDFPGSVVVTNPRNSDDRADIAFTSNDNDMVIAPEYSMALQADVSLSDLSVTVQGHQGDITVQSIDMTVDTDPSGTGEHSFDSETLATLERLRIDIPSEQVLLQLESVELSGTSARQRLDLFAGLQQRVQGLDPESEAFLTEFVEVLRENAGEKWIGDASYTMGLDGLSFTIEDVSGSLGALGLSMTADDLDEAAAELGLSINVDDITTTDVPPQFAQLIPVRADLDLVAVDAPVQAISDQLYGYLGEAPSDEELFGPKGRRAGVGNPLASLQDIDPMEFLGILMSSEVEVVLQDFFVEADIGYVAAEGTVQPDAQAALQATADLDLQIAGLPEMIAFAQQMGGEAADGAAFVSVLAAMGRDATDEDGRDIKEFDLQLTQSGQILLNGNDMSAMMGIFQ
ncbi:hypothetical protein ABWH92_01475 [Ahrensia marina]|uniref:hypothetical protein n=1 Tax=Ahrensia marina TaxID=1514904 RepID=UPI0035D0AA33